MTVFSTITLTFFVKVDTCMKRWKCLKDRYRRNKHNVPKSGAAEGSRNEWLLGK